jgi:hypothetical protein
LLKAYQFNSVVIYQAKTILPPGGSSSGGGAGEAAWVSCLEAGPQPSQGYNFPELWI